MQAPSIKITTFGRFQQKSLILWLILMWKGLLTCFVTSSLLWMRRSMVSSLICHPAGGDLLLLRWVILLICWFKMYMQRKLVSFNFGVTIKALVHELFATTLIGFQVMSWEHWSASYVVRKWFGAQKGKYLEWGILKFQPFSGFISTKMAGFWERKCIRNG